MVEYCEGSGCRRKIILESFGEQVKKYTELGIMGSWDPLHYPLHLGNGEWRGSQPGIMWCDSY